MFGATFFGVTFFGPVFFPPVGAPLGGIDSDNSWMVLAGMGAGGGAGSND